LGSSSVSDAARVSLFAALIAVGAFIAIPFLGPVPFTLQPLMVLLAGMVLGPRLGALAVIVYLGLGLVAPVYAGGQAGVGVLIGPTGGYLVGFVAAAWVVGTVARTGAPSIARFTAAGLLGLLPLYVLGVTWLGFHLQPESLWALLVAGAIQFLPLDVVKVLVSATLARAILSSPLDLPLPQRHR
jgi:biotin transport system substrate-specific component